MIILMELIKQIVEAPNNNVVEVLIKKNVSYYFILFLINRKNNLFQQLKKT